MTTRGDVLAEYMHRPDSYSAMADEIVRLRVALETVRERVMACEPYTVPRGTEIMCQTDGLDDYWIPGAPAVVFRERDVRRALMGDTR